MTEPKKEPSKLDVVWGCSSGILIIVVCIALLRGCISQDDKPPSKPADKPAATSTVPSKGKTDDSTIKGWGKAQSKNACQDKVKQQLKSPSTAKFQGMTETQYMQNSDKTKWTIRGHVDSQNSFGAEVRTQWTCTVVPKDKDSASVEAVLIQ